MATFLFGGTFDPPHRTHLHLARTTLERDPEAELVLIPAGRSPFKVDHLQTQPHHRLAMLQRALSSLPANLQERCQIDTVELEKGDAEPTYTIDTVRQFQALRPDARLRLILGTDQLEAFDQWHEAEAIARAAPLLILVRPPWSLPTVQAYLATEAPAFLRDAEVLDTVPDNVSSTSIRLSIARGEGIPDAVPAPVAEYIAEHGLYARSSS